MNEVLLEKVKQLEEQVEQLKKKVEVVEHASTYLFAIGVNIVKDTPDAVVPQFKSGYASGGDLYSIEDYELMPGERKLFHTGIRISLPLGFEAQVRPRSGLALKHGITVLNTPGTVDADYRGEVGVILINLGEEKFTVSKGDRIAQLVIIKVTHAMFKEVDKLDDTERGAGGFGHTGK